MRLCCTPPHYWIFLWGCFLQHIFLSYCVLEVHIKMNHCDKEFLSSSGFFFFISKIRWFSRLSLCLCPSQGWCVGTSNAGCFSDGPCGFCKAVNRAWSEHAPFSYHISSGGALQYSEYCSALQKAHRWLWIKICRKITVLLNRLAHIFYKRLWKKNWKLMFFNDFFFF